MKLTSLLPTLVILGTSIAFSQTPAQATTADSVAVARAKMDSLTGAIEKTVYTEQQQNVWTKCGELKLDFITKNRKTDKPYRKVDSLLHSATKVDKLPPSDPKVQDLMQKKFVLQQKWEQKYRLSPAGKRCIDLETLRKHQLDSALASHPDYVAWKHLIESPTAPK